VKRFLSRLRSLPIALKAESSEAESSMRNPLLLSRKFLAGVADARFLRYEKKPGD